MVGASVGGVEALPGTSVPPRILDRVGPLHAVVTDDPRLLRLLAAEHLAGIVEIEHSLRDVVERQLLAREVSA